MAGTSDPIKQYLATGKGCPHCGYGPDTPIESLVEKRRPQYPDFQCESFDWGNVEATSRCYCPFCDGEWTAVFELSSVLLHEPE